jgi:hypothetical protein
MPDAPKLSYFCEGDDDFAVVEWLVQAGRLPGFLESRRPSKDE